MRVTRLGMVSLVSVLVFVAAFAQDQDCDKEKCESAEILIPLKDVNAGCCTSAIQKAFSAIPGVKSASAKPGEATITMKDGKRVALSEVEKAVAKAQQAMGKSMGLNYAVDRDKLTHSQFALKVGEVKDAKKLEPLTDLLKGIEGVTGVRYGKKEGKFVTVILDADSSISLSAVDKVFKGAKYAVRETILFASCPDCKECQMNNADGAGAKCPKCRTK